MMPQVITTAPAVAPTAINTPNVSEPVRQLLKYLGTAIRRFEEGAIRDVRRQLRQNHRDEVDQLIEWTSSKQAICPAKATTTEDILAATIFETLFYGAVLDVGLGYAGRRMGNESADVTQTAALNLFSLLADRERKKPDLRSIAQLESYVVTAIKNEIWDEKKWQSRQRFSSYFTDDGEENTNVTAYSGFSQKSRRRVKGDPPDESDAAKKKKHSNTKKPRTPKKATTVKVRHTHTSKVADVGIEPTRITIDDIIPSTTRSTEVPSS